MSQQIRVLLQLSELYLVFCWSPNGLHAFAALYPFRHVFRIRLMNERITKISIVCHGVSSPCHALSVRPPTSNRRSQGGHPRIERMRDAHGRLNILLPLQRRFKARKNPERSPTGLKCLMTQNTTFSINRNRRGTPSGVPKPIHKRKLILVKEEFNASCCGGGAESRTPVHTSSFPRLYKLSLHSISNASRLQTGLTHSCRFRLSARPYRSRDVRAFPEMTSRRDGERPGLTSCYKLSSKGVLPRVVLVAN